MWLTLPLSRKRRFCVCHKRRASLRTQAPFYIQLAYAYQGALKKFARAVSVSLCKLRVVYACFCRKSTIFSAKSAIFHCFRRIIVLQQKLPEAAQTEIAPLATKIARRLPGIRQPRGGNAIAFHDRFIFPGKAYRLSRFIYFSSVLKNFAGLTFAPFSVTVRWTCGPSLNSSYAASEMVPIFCPVVTLSPAFTVTSSASEP